MIISNTTGRLRFRHEDLKNKKILESTVATLLQKKGIKTVTSNIRIGSILILYDSSVIEEKSINMVFSSFEESITKGSCTKKWYACVAGLNEHSLLRTSYVAMLLGLFINRRLHIWSGSIFALFSLIHMIRKRGNILSSDKKR